MSAITRRPLWLAAGWLLVAYVVLTFVGAAFQPQLTLGAKPSEATSALVTSSMAKVFTGEYIELLASLVFLAAALLLARLLRGGDDVTGWLASCVAGGAILYVAVQMATGGAAAAALYDGHHGAPLTTITTVDDIRSIGYSVSGGVAGALVIAASAAAGISRVLPRWFVYAGYVVGVVCLGAVPAAKAGAPQTLLWFAWVLAAGVVALRRARVSGETGVRTALATS